jgi:hypothetical protein
LVHQVHHLVLCNYVLDKLVVSFNYLFSLPLFNFCVVNDFVVSYIDVFFCAWPGGIIKQ